MNRERMTRASYSVATRQEVVGQRQSQFRLKLVSGIAPSSASSPGHPRRFHYRRMEAGTFRRPPNIHGNQIVILDHACLSLNVAGVGQELRQVPKPYPWVSTTANAQGVPFDPD